MKLFDFFNKKETSKFYTVKLQERNDDYPAYTLTSISANSKDEAAEKAKRFVAENGWWPFHSTIEQRMSRLTAVDIVEE